ncbi:MAG TPA: ferredoxin reductase family protein [Chloroflexota bacterium]|nr:ferredoxin reductase family protein [Chloroflexota bacterium]
MSATDRSLDDPAGGASRDWPRREPAPPAAVPQSQRIRHWRHARAALPGRLFWLGVAANAGVIVWLWARNNSAMLQTWPAFYTGVGRITGLLGAYLLLVQVLLLARIPPIERLAGFDRLTVWHRRNGKLCLYLIIAHVVFITAGYALLDKLSISGEASTLLGQYPGMIAATIGTGLLILVVITSLVIVRRRMRYEMWYLVHLLAYAGIGLSWFHEIPTGNELVVNPTAAAYWTALYLATLALLVLFRIAQPALRSLWFGLRVAQVLPESDNVVSLRITGRHLDRLGAQPGQFFLWRFLSRGRWWESHPFSLSAAPDGRSLRVTVKSAGDFSGKIGALRPGTPIVAEGPFGTFTEAVRRRDRVLLIAGGIGITPVRALLETMAGDLILLYRVMSEDDLVFRDEIDRLAAERGFTVHYVVGDHRLREHRHLLSARHLPELVPDIAEREVYLCGPPAMMRLLAGNVRGAGVPRKFIHTEEFAL